MKNPCIARATRSSLLSSAASTRYVAGLVAGSAAFSGSIVHAVDWDGSESTDWNTAGNWVGDVVPDGAVATVSTTSPNIATIDGDVTAVPTEIQVGRAGLTGQVDHISGSISNTANSALVVGGGGSGSVGMYNLCDTTTAGPGITGFAQGSGSMVIGGGPNDNGNWLIGDSEASSGTVKINTSGTVTITNDIFVGRGNATSAGFVYMESGTVTAGAASNGCWVAFGREGGSGTLMMTGGTINSYGSMFFPRDAGSTGTTNLSGGELNALQGNFAVADGGTGTFTMTGGAINVSTGEWFIGNQASGTATFTMSGGTVSIANNWIAIGREGATGTLNQSAGTVTKAGNGSVTIGTGENGSGTVNLSGGLFDVQSGDFIVGENNTATGNFTLSGTGTLEVDNGVLLVARDGTTTGNVNLDGGILRTRAIDGGAGTANVEFNGTQIVALEDRGDFINELDLAEIQGGGLWVDTNGFSVTSTADLSGSGNVTKDGEGTLRLLAGFDNTYTGNNIINQGQLVLSADQPGFGTSPGNVTVADGAAFGVTALFPGDQLAPTDVSFGTTAAGSSLNLNVGNVNGTNPTDHLLDVTGSLSVADGSQVVVNVAGELLETGKLPLVSYVPGSRSGTGTFSLGTLPAGVVATLVDDTVAGEVYLDITSVALPEWNGTDAASVERFGDTTNGSPDLTVPDTTGVAVGQSVVGIGIPDGAVVTGVAGTTVTIDMNATADGVGVGLTFTAAGSNDGVWDTATNNFIDQVTESASAYADPAPVLFSDNANGPTAITLNETVAPTSVLFNNEFLAYSLGGTGKITGDIGILKQGAGALDLSGITNDFTQPTRLEGGTTTVASLTNGGAPSPLGTASTVQLAGGTLALSGGAETSARVLEVSAFSGLSIASDLTLTSAPTSTGGGIDKSGAGTLELTNAGPNNPGNLRVAEGAAVFQTAGQTVNLGGLQLSGGTSVDITDATVNSTGDVNVADSAGTSTLTLSGNTVFNTSNRTMTGMNGGGATGNIMISGNAQYNQNGGWLSMGQSDGGFGTLTVMDSGSWTQAGSDFNISDLANSTGTLNLQDNGTITHNGNAFWGKGDGAQATINISGGTYTATGETRTADAANSTATVNQTGGTVNMNGGYNPIARDGTAVYNISAGELNWNGWSILGRDGNGSGTLNVSGTGVVNQVQGDRPLMVGEFGEGILNVDGGTVNSAGNNGLILANEPAGTGTVNLNGGTLTVMRVREGNDGNGGAGGASTFNFNGGILRAGEGANMNFMSGLDSAVIQSGGAFIDTNGQTVAIAQVLDDGGGDLTKQGDGTLLLNAVNSYFGNTTVTGGALGGSGGVSGALTVNNGAAIAPGDGVGTFTASSGATIAGTYQCELDGANADSLAVFGNLNITGATIDFDQVSAPTSAFYIIANYTSLTGTFTEVDVPAGYAVDYNYLGGNQIALVSTGATPYDAWASSYGLDPATDGAPSADPDGDLQPNSVEFALGGDPTDPSNNAKVYVFGGDSDVDGDTTPELLMTIAVRAGTPVFSGSPSPSATMDGYTYTVEGDVDGLSAFASPVSATTAAVAPPNGDTPPTGYEFRTFSLDGSNGFPSSGFLRVDITP